MPDTDVKALFLQVDASVELLRRNLAAGEQPLARFEQRAQRTAQNVDQSLAKMGSQFGTFAKLAEDASTRFERSFNDSFARVQQQAKTAISAPKVQGGGLNLGSDELRAAAASARQYADATALIEQAAIRASAGEGTLTQETRAYLAAAQAARIEAERNAQALLGEAAAAERLETELALLSSEGRSLAVAGRSVVTQTGAQRAGFQQLSFQIGDVATQFGSGTALLQIFAQQAGQTVQAIGLLTTESKGFIGFLGGPWGQIITAAIVLVTSLATAHGSAADATDKHKAAADDLKDAVDRLNNAAASEERTTRLGIQSDLDRANSLRAREIQTRKTLQAELELARSKLQGAQRAAVDPTLAGEGGFNAGAIAASTYASQANSLASQIVEQDKKIADASKAIVVGRTKLAERDVAASRDPRTGITSRFEDRQDVLRRQFQSGRISESAFRSGLDSATAQRDAQLSALDKSGRKGAGGNSAAARAETARQKVISEDISFNDQERQARTKLLDATRRTTASEEARDALLREDINVEADAQGRKIALQRQQGKLTAAEAQRLNQLNEQTRKERLNGVELDKQSRTLNRQTDARLTELDADIAILRIKESLAVTERERRSIAEQLLAKEQEQARLKLETIANDPRSSGDQVQGARDQLSQLPSIQQAQKDRLSADFKSPIAQYRDQLKAAGDDINASFQSIEVGGLRSLEDGLVDVITGVRSVGDVFKSIANQIIADLIRIAIQKVIVNALGSIIGHADGGEIPKFAGGGSIQKFAGGGQFRGPGGPRTDNLLALVSPGEFIINAAATKDNLALLQMINEGRTPGFADGGLIPAPSSIKAPSFPSSLIGGGGNNGSGVVKVMVSLTEDLNARIDNRAAGVSVEVVRGAAPQIVEAAKIATIQDARRFRT